MQAAFIVIEGPDGVGKDTQARRLADRLGAALYSFPDRKTPTGRLIDQHLRREVWLQDVRAPSEHDPLMYQCLALANKYEAAGRIIADLKSGRPVVASRWWPSALVYGASDGLNLAWLAETHAHLPRAHLYLYLDVPLEESLRRRPGSRDRYEQDLAKQEDVRRRYRELWTSPRRDLYLGLDDGVWVIVDGTGTEDEVAVRVSAEVLHAAVRP